MKISWIVVSTIQCFHGRTEIASCPLAHSDPTTDGNDKYERVAEPVSLHSFAIS